MASIWSAGGYTVVCVTLNSRIQALKLNHIFISYSFEEYYFGATMGNAKILVVKIECL